MKRGQMEAGQTGPPSSTTRCFSGSFIYKAITVAGLLISIKSKTQAYSLDIQLCPFPELMLVLEGKLFFFIFAAPWYFFEKTVFKSHLNYSYKCFTRCSWLNTKQFRPIRLLWKPTGGYRCGLDGTVDLNTTMAAPRDVLLLCLELHQNWRVVFFSRKESKERH